jgi:superoxide dismutase, Cu-Zn family
MRKPAGLLFSLASILTLWTNTAVLAQNNQSVTVANVKIEGQGIVGQAKFVESAPGFVLVTIEVKGDPKILTPGLHGIHFHAVGSCESGATPFSGAGGHFDPGPNGSSTPVEANHPYHLGDLPNLVVDAQGMGRLQTTTSRISLADSPTTAFDADGTAIIIHANQDQIKAGGTAAEAGGGRLACGVIQKGLGVGQ